MKKILATAGEFLKKRWLPLTLVTLVAGIFFLPGIAFAEDGSTTDTSEKAIQALVTMVAVVLQVMSAVLWPFLLVIGNLMDSDLIIGPGMEDKLLSIWVQVRNLVNIGFVIVLLIIALSNVLGIGGSEGNFAIKTALPKLVIGLILVNFTFLAGRVLLDVSNVATTAVFALPELVGQENFDFDAVRTEFEEKVCGGHANKATNEKTIPVFTMMVCEVNEEGAEVDANGNMIGAYTGKMNEWMKASYFKDLNVNNVSIIMAINMGALDTLGLLKPEAVKTWSDLTINTIFSFVMYFVFAISYIVLGLVLLARIVVLWVAMALSPLVVLFYVVPQLKESVGSNLDIMEKVTKHLLAPIIIGLTMSIGIIMMTAMDSFSSLSGTTLDNLMSTKFMLSGSNDMENFIVAIVTVVVIWTGVFAAAEGTVASFATNAIKGFGEQIGTAIAKAPLYLPTLPIGLPGGGEAEKVSPAAIFGLANAARRNLTAQSRVDEQSRKIVEKSPLLKKFVGNELGSAAGLSAEENARAATEIANQGIDADTADDIAENIYHAADKGSSLEGGDKKQLVTQLSNALKTARNERKLQPLRDILNAHTNPSDLGLSQQQYDRIKQSVDKYETQRLSPSAAPAAPTTRTLQDAGVNFTPANPVAGKTWNDLPADATDKELTDVGYTTDQIRQIRTTTGVQARS